MSIFDLDNCRRCGAPTGHQDDYCDDYPNCKPAASEAQGKPDSEAKPNINATREAKTPQLVAPHEGLCQSCGSEYPTPWFTDNPVWNQANAKGNFYAFLCPNCFIRKAQQSGVNCSGWHLAACDWTPPVNCSHERQNIKGECLDCGAVERVQPIELDIPDRREYPDDPISQLSDDVLRESRIRKGREWLKEHGLLPNVERVQPEPASVEPQVEPSRKRKSPHGSTEICLLCRCSLTGDKECNFNCACHDEVAADSVSHPDLIERLHVAEEQCQRAAEQGESLIAERDREWCLALAEIGVAALASSVRGGKINVEHEDKDSVSHPPLEQEIAEWWSKHQDEHIKEIRGAGLDTHQGEE